MRINTKGTLSAAVLIASVESSSWNPFVGSPPRATSQSGDELTIPESLDSGPAAESGSSSRPAPGQWGIRMAEDEPGEDDEEVERQDVEQPQQSLLLKKDTSRIFDTEISAVPDLPSRVAFFGPEIEETRMVERGKGNLKLPFGLQFEPPFLFDLSQRDGSVAVAVEAARPVQEVVAIRRPHNTVDVCIDPLSMLRCGQVLLAFASSVSTATWGTLRLLAPLVVSAKVYRSLCDSIDNLQRSRKGQRLEFLQSPKLLQQRRPLPLLSPSLRSVGRVLAHAMVLSILGRAMEWSMGLTKYPCRFKQTGGCRWICSVLWLGPVLGVGHVISSAIALWGGPFQLQVQYKRRRPTARSVCLHPDRFREWLKQPDEWIREVANDRRFFSSNMLQAWSPVSGFLSFPTRWEPIWILMILGVTKEMTSGRDTMHTMMRLVLLQQAFRDEWHRVLLVERRVLLGLIPAAGYFGTTLALFFTVFRKPALSISSLSILLLLPSVLAILISTWMNLVVYLDQEEMKRQQAAAEAAAMAAESQLPYTSPSVPSYLST